MGNCVDGFCPDCNKKVVMEYHTEPVPHYQCTLCSEGFSTPNGDEVEK